MLVLRSFVPNVSAIVQEQMVRQQSDILRRVLNLVPFPVYVTAKVPITRGPTTKATHSL